MISKIDIKLINEEIDSLFKEQIRELGYCEYCQFKHKKATTGLEAHHFFSCSRMSIRWDPDNMFCLCAEHHTLNSEFSAHLTPVWFIEWAKEYRGEDWYNRLWNKSITIKQWSDKELIELYKKLKKNH